MIVIQMPKDVRRYEVKELGCVSIRQLTYYVIGAVFAIPGIVVIVHGLTIRQILVTIMGVILAAWLALPFLILGIQREIDRTPTEIYMIRLLYRTFLAPKKRRDKPVNLYRKMFEKAKLSGERKAYKKMSASEKRDYDIFKKKGIVKTSKNKELKIYR